MNIITALRRYRIASIRISTYHFNPGAISTLVTAALLYTMISLAFWQLDRAEFKDTLQQKIEHRKSLSAVDFNALPDSSEQRRYLPTTFFAEVDAQHNFLLDNKIVNGRVGYHVFTPVKITDKKAILVARGFIKMGITREQLPDIETANGRLEFKGLLDLPPSRALLLAENVHQTNTWPMVLQYVDLTEISEILGYELYDMVLWLNHEETVINQTPLEYDLPVLNLNSAKNNGYAFQWFALSIALLVIYIVVNTKRITHNA